MRETFTTSQKQIMSDFAVSQIRNQNENGPEVRGIYIVDNIFATCL